MENSKFTIATFLDGGAFKNVNLWYFHYPDLMDNQLRLEDSIISNKTSYTIGIAKQLRFQRKRF